MKTLLIAQLAIPLLLAAWMVARPARSDVGLGAQAAGSVLGLAALGQVGLWLFPPWWTPHAAALLAIAAAGWTAWRRPRRTRWPTQAFGWAGVALFSLLGAGGILCIWRAHVAARLPNNVEVVDLAFPFAAGRFVVVNGGAWTLLNAHRASMDTSIARLQAWRGNGHAVDIIATNTLGARAPGLLPQDPEAYRIFGTPVIAPCHGSVIAAVDGLRDMPVPEYDRDNMAGNHVILDCGGVHVVLAHLKRGSVLVRAGDQVEVTAAIGEVGNSGGTSEPHLHIHAQRPGPPNASMAGDPVPMRLNGRYLARGDRVTIGR